MESCEPVAKRRRTRGTIQTENDLNIARPSNQESQPNRIGRIERVQLINFMCHANFTVEFNKHVNIFVGCNGIGKSAIITAVVIGLGGNAVAAEFKNIAQLIRRGETSASIEITLHNEGIDSYKYEKYGNRISVLRQISANGASQYRIKSENGETVTRSLRNLQSMLTYMNIQVDNPICVLNQDAARTFLKESDPRQRHLLFSKTTQLQQIIQIFEEAANSLREPQPKLRLLQQEKVKQIKDYKEARNHYQRLMSVETLKADLQNLKIELEWNKVSQEESKYEAFVNKLAEINGKIEELKRSIESWSDDMRRFHEERVDFIIERNETKATIDNYRSAYDSLHKSRAKRFNQLARQETKYKDMIAKLEPLKKKIYEHEKKLLNLLAERDENRTTETKLQEDVQLHNENSQAVESTMTDSQYKQRDPKQNMGKHEVDELQNELKELQNEYDSINSAIENRNHDSENLQQELKMIDHDIKLNQAETEKLEITFNEKIEQTDTLTEKIYNLAVNNFETDLKKCKTSKKKLVNEESKQEAILKKVKQSATEKGERIDNNRGANKILSLIKSTENKIQKRCSSTDDITTVKTLMLELEKIYKQTEASIDASEGKFKTVSSVSEARYSWLFKEYQPFTALPIENPFLLTLKSRKCDVELHINHEQKTLDFNMPQGKNIKDAVSNSKSLSGDADVLSFSSLAFLTSLWSCVSSPFFFLDEYDVFTDQTYSRFMAQLLISEAMRRSDRQFCFFTPQDMSFVEESDSVTFHRLKGNLKSK